MKIAVTLKAWRDERRIRLRQVRALAQLKSIAAEISAHCLDDVATLAEWERRRPRVLGQLQWMLGLDPLPRRTPLQATITGVVERSGYRIEKLVFESLPGMHVTGNFYVPKEAARPVPCVVYLCGHMVHPCGPKTQYQERFLWYPAHGFACLAVDSLACGEVPGLHHGTQNMNLWDWFSRGYTPAGLEVWNAMRALDYLETRPEVDRQRMGVTGISGGGVMTWLLAALDDRIKAAAPSCSTYTLGSQAALGLIPSQCDCTFYPNVYRLDFPSVGALIAPRPLLMTSGIKDRIFPPAGFRAAFGRTKKIYDLYGRGAEGSERIRSVESNTAHTDPPLFLQESRRWMCRWLHPEPESVLPAVADTSPAAEPADALTCLAQPPRESANYTVHDHFLRAATPTRPASLEDWQKRRQQLLQELRQTTFAWFPPDPPPVVARRLRGSGGSAAHFAKFSEWVLETEPGVSVRALAFYPKHVGPNPPVLIVVKRMGDRMVVLDDEWLPVLGSHAVIVLNPRFSEHPLPAAEYAHLERLAATTGRTIAALQVWDVMRTAQWALEHGPVPAARVSLYGRGTAGIVALYAALFEPRIGQVVLRDPPATHREGPALLTVLRTTDIPEVAAALAPRTLSMLSDPPPAFDFVQQAYRLCGAEAQFQRAAALTTAVWPSP